VLLAGGSTTGAATTGRGPLEDIDSVDLAVPSGTYAVSASAIVFNGSTTQRDVDCALNGGNKFVAELEGGAIMTIPLLGSFTGPGTISLDCTGFNILLYSNSVVQAIKVG